MTDAQVFGLILLGAILAATWWLCFRSPAKREGGQHNYDDSIPGSGL